jgi:chitin disaccharide deacetylase
MKFRAERLDYSREDVLVIVHADDMGAHRDQTDGSLEAMEVGMCQAGSVMVPCPDFERLLSICQHSPELDLGIHLTLNSEWGTRYGWPPVLPRSQVPSLYNADGILWPTEGELKRHMDVHEALREVEAQVTRVLEAGVEPTHVDDHMGCYWQHPDLADGVIELARTYNLPMNPVDRDKMRKQGYLFPDAFWMFTNNLALQELQAQSWR